MKGLLYSLMTILTIHSFCLTSARASEEDDVEYKDMEQMMGSIHLEKKQVESMVEKLVVSGRITADDAQKAKRELASMNESDLENLKSKAMAEVKSKRLLDK